MSSGSSVLSTIPPKSARIERLILVHSPIFTHPPANSDSKITGQKCGGSKRERALVCTTPKRAQLQVTADFGVSIAKNSGPWAVGRKAVAGLTGGHRTYDRSLTNIAPVMHPVPVN